MVIYMTNEPTQEQLYNGLVIVMTEQTEILKNVTDCAMKYIKDTNEKLLFLNDCKRVAIESKIKIEKLQKELGL